MAFQGIMELLNRRIGLHGEALSPKAFNRAVRERMARLELADVVLYRDLLIHDVLEMERLIDQVVVHETWFFRDVEPFRYLRRHLVDLIRKNPKKPVRVLSIPCASGEEPYSIAMVAADITGPDGIWIDAVDVSRAALEKARVGRYGPNAFRASEMEPYRRYFRQMAGEWQLSENIMGVVHFHHGNILDYGTLNLGAPYHVIFCRNLLIYLDEKSRRLAVDHIDRLLAENGLLFLGYAESRQQLFPDYITVRHQRAYASLKPGSQPLPDTASFTRSVKKPKAIKLVKLKAPDVISPAQTASSTTSADEPPQPAHDLDAMELAGQLADAGRIEDAARICRDILVEDPARVDAHFLLGVVALAGGDENEAESCFSRALYLNPEHEDSLNYMILLMEKFGREQKAALLRSRLGRLQKRRPPEDERKAESS